MRVALCSIFRDSEPYLDRYYGQVLSLRHALWDRGDLLTCIWVEGDSVDNTEDRLHQMASVRDFVGIYDHGGPSYGSVDLLARWRQLAPVCNATMDQVSQEDDAVIYVESDLIWDADTMVKLLDRLTEYPAVGGLVYHAAGFFYDTYAYRLNGSRFGADFQPVGSEPFQIDSVGSCIVMTGDVARSCRFGADTCLIGESLAAHGYELWVDPTCRIVHP